MGYQKVKSVVGVADAEADGSLPYSILAAATTNANLVKSAPGYITAIHAINVNAAVRYLRLYDSAKLPVAGSGTPSRRYAIPGSATGAGFVMVMDIPMRFLNGIGFTMTTGVADSDVAALTANDVILTIEYV